MPSKNGKLGVLVSSWYKNGKKRYLKRYKDGLKDGMFKNWYPSGEKKSTSHYKNGFRKEWGEMALLRTVQSVFHEHF